MKALSLRQPYAELLVTGRKTIELRKWKTRHRGKFLVHASKYKPTDEELDQFKLKREDLDFGAIIGSAVLIDIKDYGNCVESEWARDCDKHLAGAEYIESQIGFLLKDAVKFDEPRPFKGQLNFFETDYKQEKLC